MKKFPDFLYEKKLWNKNFEFVAGVDEVGKGCFAGPIVAGCVVFPKSAGPDNFGVLSRNSPTASPPASKHGAPSVVPPASCHPSHNSIFFIPDSILINDSKQMSPKQRERASIWIKKNAIAWGIGQASASQINRLGITKAAEIAFRKAIKSCGKIDFLLVDAFYIPFVKGLRRKNQKAIIKGDTKSISIAAASIIAKVYRDKLMLNLSKRPKYAKYGWGRNKGYGTREHQAAIKKYGTTRQHRKQYVQTWLNHFEQKTRKEV